MLTIEEQAASRARPMTALDAVGPPITGTLLAHEGAQPKLAPSRADLVEQYGTGKWYLRAFTDGHFLWQPVAGSGDAIPDGGTWLTGRRFHDTYWINHGAYRRRAGSYHPVDQPVAARRAA